jgi:GT2 family glycosyltransferase
MEEIDLCWRMHRHGWGVEACSSSLVYHVGGGTLTVGSPRKTFLNVRNSLLTVVRNAPSASAMRIVAFRLLVDGLAGIRYLIQGQPKHTLAIVQAHFDFYRRFSLYALNPGKNPKSWPQVGVYSGSILWNQLRRRPSTME